MTETRRSRDRPRVIAHRGDSAHHPENTIAAFRAAAELGADMVELDVRATSDGGLAVHHDAGLPDGRAIAATAAADLPHDVPLLAAALDACAVIEVNIEIKSEPGAPGAADSVVALLDARGGRDTVLVSSFDWAAIERVRALAPGLATALLVVRPAASDIERVVAAGHGALHPHFRFVTEELIRECHAAGLEVNCWTCDGRARMVKMARWGIDGICTNDPALALQVLSG